MRELFTVYLIALFLMLIVLIRMIRQINEKQRVIKKKHRRSMIALTKDKEPEDIYHDVVNEYEAELQRLKYYKATAYIVAFTLTYCIIDCLLFNI